MNETGKAFLGADIHDGERLFAGYAFALGDDGAASIAAPGALSPAFEIVHLEGGILTPGFVDLQVNGGGGVMFNDDQSIDALRRIAEAHRSRGTVALLPTLITDTPEVTAAAIDAVVAAIGEGVPGIVGIHLEGPHLSVARKGAHDPNLIRRMEQVDLDLLLDAAAQLPNVMVTVAPENTTPEQISRLANAGVIVSLGHTDASFADCMAAFDAGACCVTHLFNAMSQMGNREPGLVGAALAHPSVAAGLIADAIHVHPATMRNALAAKPGPDQIFLVTDAMATAGSNITGFHLNGREIVRRDGQLTLSDGTLAGADLDFPRALEVLTGEVGISIESALRRATSAPAGLLRKRDGLGSLAAGANKMIYLSGEDFSPKPLPR